MTFIVCPHLAIDRVLTAPAVSSGQLTRCRALVHQAGGKGANVARALATLSAPFQRDRDLLLGLGAGHTGRLFAELAHEEGLEINLVACEGEMRISTVILSENGEITPLFERGPQIDATDASALLGAVASRPPTSGEWAIVDGADPPGAHPAFFADICRALKSLGYRVLVDAADEQLAHSLAAGPDLVKVNFPEALSALAPEDGRSSSDATRARGQLVRESLGLCRRLIDAGAVDAIITLGAAGAVGLINGREWQVETRPVNALNTVGSGDCFAAAVLMALESGLSVEAMLAAGAGAGAANAVSALTGHLDAALARELAASATVRQHLPGEPGFPRVR